MPALDPNILNCVFYAYPSVDAARNGERIGGCGFFAVVPLSGFFDDGPGFAARYAVTNSHVIRGIERTGGSPVLRINTPDDRFTVVGTDPSAWIHHPDGDDIAIAPLVLPDEIRWGAVSPGSFIQRGDPRWYGPGLDTVMVSRFISHEGKQRNTPALRFGHISMLPDEPILTEHGLKQESYLVEVRSLPGHSGSPVFVYRSQLFGDLEEGILGSVVRFLGIDYAHIGGFDPVLASKDRHDRAKPERWVAQNSGMMAVVPAWKLIELLQDEEVVEMRKRAEDDWRRGRGGEPTIFP